MKVGVIKETKDKENRVAATPEGVKKLDDNGHEVLVEENAGNGSGFADEEYEKVGAKIVSAEEAWNSELILKVKEPLENEYQYLKENQILFTYLHLAGAPKSLTEAMLEKKTTGIAYETVENNRKLPLLAPMSAVAGNMAPQIGAFYLAKFNNGRGVMLGNVNGMVSGKAVIIGGGFVGMHAAKTAVGLGTEVYVLDINEERLRFLEKEIPGLKTMISNKENIKNSIKDADLVVGAVLVPGGKAPKVVTEEMVRDMQPGSVLVDVAIDQGGCIETSKPTKHSDPIFVKHDVIHYCVTNMPGAYPRTSTIALTKETLPYALKLAEKGVEAVKESEGFMKGVNTYKGFITYEEVAKDLEMEGKFKELNGLF